MLVIAFVLEVMLNVLKIDRQFIKDNSNSEYYK
ncbi:hypothetical protein SBY92_000540 [Candida maltosa Xu316]